ncbi:MAG TPA: hypothetical protein VFQ92_19480 [Blastocatellia bacterium]|nr:hypothetical protein [Blastocatellia bacterium]
MKIRKKPKRQSKPRAKTARKKRIDLERIAPVLACEVNLRCHQYRQVKPGRFEACGKPATCFLPTYGDACDSCAGKRPQVRYATVRRAIVKKAA